MVCLVVDAAILVTKSESMRGNTQGASGFATSPEGLRQILELLGTQASNRKTFPSYFECILRVETTKGLDAMQVKYVDGSALAIQE